MCPPPAVGKEGGRHVQEEGVLVSPGAWVPPPLLDAWVPSQGGVPGGAAGRRPAAQSSRQSLVALGWGTWGQGGGQGMW